MTSGIEKANDKFQNYLMCMSDNLVELGNYVKEFHGRDDVFDYSLESLDDVEEFLGNQLDEPSLEQFPEDKLIEVVSSYMGEIVKRKLNGRWSLCTDKKDYDYGYPMVDRLEGLPEDFGWSPIQVVLNFMKTENTDY